MITIITEKTLVARRISRVVGALQRKVGYYGGNDFCVTWTDDYMPREQRNVIRNLFNHSDMIVAAMDYSAEGERAFRDLWLILGCENRPIIRRLWLNSLTEKAIRKGLENLHGIHELDFLCNKCPSEQEAAMKSDADVILSAICGRYWKHDTFEPKPFWYLHFYLNDGGNIWKFNCTESILDEKDAEHLYAVLKDFKKGIVHEIRQDLVEEEAPQLYDLLSLQQDANEKYGFSAMQTQQIAQKLFEAGVITYPHTHNRFIPEEVFNDLPRLLRTLRDNPKWGALSMTIRRANPLVVRDIEPFEHHAILITGEKLQHPSDNDKKIYNLIVRRMLEALSEKCVKEVETATVLTVGLLFSAKATGICKAGWRFIGGEELTQTHLPEWTGKKVIKLTACGITGCETMPKPLHTEATLIGETSNCNNHAAIIERLIEEEKIIRLNTQMIPTPKGMATYSQILKEKYKNQ